MRIGCGYSTKMKGSNKMYMLIASIFAADPANHTEIQSVEFRAPVSIKNGVKYDMNPFGDFLGRQVEEQIKYYQKLYPEWTVNWHTINTPTAELYRSYRLKDNPENHKWAYSLHKAPAEFLVPQTMPASSGFTDDVEEWVKSGSNEHTI